MHVFTKKRCLLFAAMLVIAWNGNYVSAQKSDTSGIIEKIVEKIDTVVRIVFPDSSLEQWSDKPIDSVLFGNSNNRFSKELHDLIVKSVPDSQKNPTRNISLAASDGKIIRRIEVVNVDIFAPSITDTGYTGKTWLEKTINISHNDTRARVLERYLIIEPGDVLDVFKAAENEKILRELSFIMDARFIPRPVEGSPDSIDLVLLTQDKFPLGIKLDLLNSSVAMVEFSHQNVLGLAHQFLATGYFDTENVPHFGYRLSYGSPNFRRTFTSIRADYIHKWNQETYQVNVSRDFKAMSLRNAGGFSFESTDQIRNVDLIDTLYKEVNVSFTNTDIWAGRIILPLKSRIRSVRTGFYMAARFSVYNNIRLPQVEEIYMEPFVDRKLMLISAGIASQGFRKDNMIYTFGRPEDVPYGFLLNITSGATWTQAGSMPYVSMAASYGTYFGNAHFHSMFRFGTFINNSVMQQGIFNLKLNYFSPLHKYMRYRYRYFINFNYVTGLNRYPGEFLSISDASGIAGLRSPSLRGHDKVVMNLESVVFTPFNVFGFRFAVFGGLDLGLLKRHGDDFADSRLFSGLNIGVRIRNDRLVFDTFVIRFSVYPGKPSQGTAKYFVIDYEPGIRFDDYLPDRPEVIPYK